MKKLLGLVAIVVLIAPGCVERENAERDLKRFLLATERLPREFTYTETVPGQEWKVTGRVEDDLRFESSGKVNGADAIAVVVSDDTLALRVMDPTKVPGLLGVVPGSEVGHVGSSLLSGKWVVDPAGAPPLQPLITKEGTISVGQNQILDAAYLFQYLRRAIDEGQDVWEFNPDDLEYRPAEDPFEKPQVGLGIVRYDVRPPPLPRRSQRGTAQALPTTAHFRRLSFYVRDQRIFRVEEQIEYESHPDFRRAREGRGPQYPLQILEAIRAGRTLEPIRIRRMTYEIVHLGKSIEVLIPIENTISAALEGVFGGEGITRQREEEAEPSPGPPSDGSTVPPPIPAPAATEGTPAG